MLILQSANAQTIYKCKGGDGETVFSERACGDDAQSVDVGPTNSSEATTPIPRSQYRQYQAGSSAPSRSRGAFRSQPSGEACRKSKAYLEKYERQRKTARRRSYTVAEENSYTGLIADWQDNVKIFCRWLV